jgi:hypothetical protein
VSHYLSEPSRALERPIREGYEQNLSERERLRHLLKRTEKLIDQVVYRLYGLTEEERQVVEGKTSSPKPETPVV